MIKECREYVKSLTPKLNETRVVVKGNVRIGILTERLLRIEGSDDGIFTDDATTVVTNRNIADGDFKVSTEGDVLTVETRYLTLRLKGDRLTKENLSVTVRFDDKEKTWHYGEKADNLKGTARTLDNINGPVELDGGIVSKEGYSILDDSESCIFTEDGWVRERPHKETDIYFFGYGHDYNSAVKDFFLLCGKTERLPRFVFGNWWSRFYPYTEESYEKLMDEFEEKDIPLSVAVIDMDWHLTDIPAEKGGGWTGYTWNRKYFPNPERFLSNLHDRGLHTTLNIHPADGVRSFEDNYDNLARSLGMDPGKGDPVSFQPGNPDFMENYFNEILHPMEKEGVDFWWIDWQQGTKVKGCDVDPLWVLNHCHFLDSKRDGKAGLTFSRYAGPGSHRYPVGFSGDAVTTWESLDFQPYFTANATNIGYCYWSHDIGGHQKGYKNDEMTVRWIQFGVFSPIMRLHSTSNPFYGKEPWNYGAEAERDITEILRLRHRLIPYLYSMNRLQSEENEPLIKPMYYTEDRPEAYEVSNEYTFGTEMIVSPVTSPRDPESKLSEKKCFLPEGEYYDFFTGLKYKGGGSVTVYRKLNEVPVFVKSGGIIPMDEDFRNSHLKNPVDLTVRVYEGKDGSFELYEDDNSGLINAKSAITGFKYDDVKKILFIKTTDPGHVLPTERKIKIVFTGKSTISVESDMPYSVEYVRYGNKKERIYTLLHEAETYYDSKENIFKPIAKDEPTAEDFEECLKIAGKEDIPGLLKKAIEETVRSI